jgi:hypothetical protein
MLPRKWKIFRIVSYLHLTVTLLLAVLLYYSLFQGGLPRVRSLLDLLGISLTVICPGALIINCILNITLLDKYYPNNIPGKRHRVWSRVLFVMALLSLLTLSFLTTASIVSWTETRDHNLRRMWPLYVFLLSAFVIVSTGFYTLWNQVSLRKMLRRNHQATMENFLELEEQTQP